MIESDHAPSSCQHKMGSRSVGLVASIAQCLQHDAHTCDNRVSRPLLSSNARKDTKQQVDIGEPSLFLIIDGLMGRCCSPVDTCLHLFARVIFRTTS